MIRYTLKCSEDHSFESWFASATAFETLKTAGQLSCPHCGSVEVEKSLMTPRVSTARKSGPAPEEATEPHPTAAPSDVARDSKPHKTPERPSAESTEATLTAMRDHVEKNSDYVGSDFTKQARAMNDGDAPARSIYGEAKIEDAKAMIEDGVPIVPLPFLPKRKLN
jgi:hypothetical protein